MSKSTKMTEKKLDVGFRVLKIDSSNMKDEYYGQTEQSDLLADGVKEGRTAEDLLFQAMLDLGIDIASAIETFDSYGALVHRVWDDTPCKECGCENHESKLLACFDDKPTINKWVALDLARMQPEAIVIRDIAFDGDDVRSDFLTIFALFSPSTVIRTL